MSRSHAEWLARGLVSRYGWDKDGVYVGRAILKMTLIERVRGLREQQRNLPHVVEAGVAEWCDFTENLRDAVPDLLDALSGFEDGDANGINKLIEWLDAMQKSSDFVISPELMQLLIRHRSMARKMEGKR